MARRRSLTASLVVAWVITTTFAARAASDDAPITDATYYVRPMGDVAPSHAQRACEIIRREFVVPCRVLRDRPMPYDTLDLDRYQFEAHALVERMVDELPSDGLGLVVLTNGDLYEAGRGPYVFGLASLVAHIGVVSLSRFRETWWGGAHSSIGRARFRERFHKVLIHEVGHTLGVPHCDDNRCAMREDRTLEELDDSPMRFCTRCGSRLVDARRHGPGTMRWHYTRGHRHLRRGEFARAVYHFEVAVELAPESPQLHNDLGVAYLRRGDAGRALWSFRHAVSLDPAFAHARYNEGLVFLGVGDASNAWRAFESVLEVDRDWALAHRQLGQLAAEVYGDGDLALRHFEEYLAAHGADASVEARIRMIKGGGAARERR